jgi:phytoene dehydrogenase-like protein
MTERIFAQIERFASAFASAPAYKTHTARYGGLQSELRWGDINSEPKAGHSSSPPHLSLQPYVTPVKGVYLCSRLHSPGGGVHGMCGYHAARAALRRL